MTITPDDDDQVNVLRCSRCGYLGTERRRNDANARAAAHPLYCEA